MEEQTYIIDRIAKKSTWHGQEGFKGAKVTIVEILFRNGPWFHADLKLLEDVKPEIGFRKDSVWFFRGVILRKVEE